MTTSSIYFSVRHHLAYHIHPDTHGTWRVSGVLGFRWPNRRNLMNGLSSPEACKAWIEAQVVAP